MVLCRGAVRFHAGIAYHPEAGNRTLRILHLAGHCVIGATWKLDEWVQVPCALDEYDLELLSTACEAVRKASAQVPYGLASAESGFDSFANWVSGREDSGLTCATFVQKVFEYAGIALADVKQWVRRPGDDLAAQSLIKYLADTRQCDADHLELLRSQAPGFVRLRPEEVAACSAAQDRPVGFRTAWHVGLCIRAETDRLLSS